MKLKVPARYNLDLSSILLLRPLRKPILRNNLETIHPYLSRDRFLFLQIRGPDRDSVRLAIFWQYEMIHELIAQPLAVRSMTLTAINRHLVQGKAVEIAFNKLQSPCEQQFVDLAAFLALGFFPCQYQEVVVLSLRRDQRPGGSGESAGFGLGQSLDITPPEHDFDARSFLRRARRKGGCPVPPRLLPGSPHDDVFRVDARPVSFVDVSAETEELRSRFGAAGPILRFGTRRVVEMRFPEWVDVAGEEGQLVEMVLDEVADLLGQFLPHHGADGGGVVGGFEGGRRRRRGGATVGGVV